MPEKTKPTPKYRIKTYIKSKVEPEFGELGKALTAAQKKEFKDACLREIYEILPGGEEQLAATLKVWPSGFVNTVQVEA